MLSKIILILALSLAANQAFCFNWRKCQSLIRKDKSLTGGGYFSSTTSFLTSTGECSMIGEASHDQKVYLISNASFVISDIAKGGGEYIEGFLKFSNSNSVLLANYPRILKGNFHLIEKCYMNDDFEELYDHLSYPIK